MCMYIWTCLKNKYFSNQTLAATHRNAESSMRASLRLSETQRVTMSSSDCRRGTRWHSDSKQRAHTSWSCLWALATTLTTNTTHSSPLYMRQRVTKIAIISFEWIHNSCIIHKFQIKLKELLTMWHCERSILCVF